MVTIRLKVRTGFLGGSMVELSVTRPTLPLALAAATWALVGRRALTLAEMLAAIRAERAVAAGTKGRIPGDPLGLGVPRQPHVTVRPWGLDPDTLGVAMRSAAAAMAAVMAPLAKAARPPAGPAEQPEGQGSPEPAAPLPLVDLRAVQAVRRKMGPVTGETNRRANGQDPRP